jgi:hypothetical protein
VVVADLVRTLSSPRWAGFHFALIGGLLFALLQGSSATPSAAVARWGETDWQSASEEELLHREALRRGLDRGDSVVRRRLVQNMRFLAPGENAGAVESDDLLHREALALGLDRSDPVVRRRLVERARQSLIAEARIRPPDDAVLRAHLAANAGRFALAERRRIEQLYFARSNACREALSALQGEADSPAEPAANLMNDPLPIARELPSLSERELAARFGPGFARQAFELTGDRWSGPLRSSYGDHLVRVLERVPERMPSLDEVRGALTAHWISQEQGRSLRAALAGLRREYAAEAHRRPS